MTPQEVENKANEIVEKYEAILPFKDSIFASIQCAITEVQAIINSNPHSNPLNTNPVYSTMDYWQQILTHLKSM